LFVTLLSKAIPVPLLQLIDFPIWPTGEYRYGVPFWGILKDVRKELPDWSRVLPVVLHHVVAVRRQLPADF
jgi:hypothetical protein